MLNNVIKSKSFGIFLGFLILRMKDKLKKIIKKSSLSKNDFYNLHTRV